MGVIIKSEHTYTVTVECKIPQWVIEGMLEKLPVSSIEAIKYLRHEFSVIYKTHMPLVDAVRIVKHAKESMIS